jgi:hypothetical protein
VRMALGADARRILGMILKQGGVQVAIGVHARPWPGLHARDSHRRRYSETSCSASAAVIRSPTRA